MIAFCIDAPTQLIGNEHNKSSCFIIKSTTQEFPNVLSIGVCDIYRMQ